ncbi:hypothetical protein D477_008418 [Arthrobacter crystallopoietes BAB-32]|uniref:DUF8094 domain-containing protein n=1 Tax=Arthrobacter crystallopoietes BAB-32 TaxID=1246476 RepID=N1V032_9MICC|nr:hypothetical protein [Arthrobacter crystallopoietes]EMY34665.1 hypothetical protein D477_008418 [Arthrobacter crystallopoietes BAB-32]
MKTAVALIAAGLVAILLGIGFRTVWAPPETLSASYSAGESTAPVTVIEPAVFGVHDERVDISVEADGEFLLAVGRAGDVEAWVGEAAHTAISAVDGGQLQAEIVEGEAEVPNPAGSDLWVSEETANGSTEHRWIEPAEGEWSILLAADGKQPAPATVTVSWPNDSSTPWSMVLFIIGALLAVLGLALAVLARRGGSDAGGPDAGSRIGHPEAAVAGASAGSAAGQRVRGRAETVAGRLVKPVFAVAAAGALAATVLQPARAAESSAASSEAGTAYPVLLDGQLNRILDSVAAAVAAGDSAQDAKELTSRVGGSALTLREANYAVRAENSDVAAPAPVAAEPLRTAMVSTTASWPRTAVAVTQGKDNQVPQVIVLSQGGPRENYKMVEAVQMLPGTTFPQVASEAGGTAAVAPDAADGLLHAPKDALELLAANLNGGKNADKVAKNTFTDQIRSFQDAQVKANENADITFSRKVAPDSVRALKTADGGAMVFGYISNVMSSVPAEPGATVELSDEFATLAGERSTTSGVDVTYGESVAVYVPPTGAKEPVSVIGVAQDLVDAKIK